MDAGTDSNEEEGAGGSRLRTDSRRKRRMHSGVVAAAREGRTSRRDVVAVADTGVAAD